MLEILYSNIWAQLALGAIVVALVAIFGDWQRSRRRHIDQVGFMPWTSISALAIMVALFATAIAIARG